MSGGQELVAVICVGVLILIAVCTLLFDPPRRRPRSRRGSHHQLLRELSRHKEDR